MIEMSGFFINYNDPKIFFKLKNDETHTIFIYNNPEIFGLTLNDLKTSYHKNTLEIEIPTIKLALKSSPFIRTRIYQYDSGKEVSVSHIGINENKLIEILENHPEIDENEVCLFRIKNLENEETKDIFI